jgi:hypothetical protein
MIDRVFKLVLWALALGFTAIFVWVVGPPLLESGDIPAAFAAGFVNPFSAGYAIDIVFCWAVLTVWVVYEAMAKGVKHGWIAVLLCLVPGVAVGLVAYLLIRGRQLSA